MTPDEKKVYAAMRKMLADLGIPHQTAYLPPMYETDKILAAYCPTDAQIVDNIVGPLTVEHPDAR